MARILEVLVKVSIKFIQKLRNVVTCNCFSIDVSIHVYKYYLGWRQFSSFVNIFLLQQNMLLTIQLCTHLFLIKNLLPSVHHAFYPIYENRETRQSGLHCLDKFWRIQVLIQIQFSELKGKGWIFLYSTWS